MQYIHADVVSDAKLVSVLSISDYVLGKVGNNFNNSCAGYSTSKTNHLSELMQYDELIDMLISVVAPVKLYHIRLVTSFFS